MSVQGKESNDECPICKKGRLRHDLVSVQTGLSDRGVRGQSIYDEVVSAHLACSACSVLFLAALRGKTVSEVMDAQLKEFVLSSTERSAQCVKCNGVLQCRADSNRPARPGSDPDRFRPFLWCEGCLHVAWASAPEAVLDVEALGRWTDKGILP